MFAALASSLRKHSQPLLPPGRVSAPPPRHVSRVTQHVTSVEPRYRGGDRRGEKREALTTP